MGHEHKSTVDGLCQVLGRIPKINLTEHTRGAGWGVNTRAASLVGCGFLVGDSSEELLEGFKTSLATTGPPGGISKGGCRHLEGRERTGSPVHGPEEAAPVAYSLPLLSEGWVGSPPCYGAVAPSHSPVSCHDDERRIPAARWAWGWARGLAPRPCQGLATASAYSAAWHCTRSASDRTGESQASCSLRDWHTGVQL